ncbi:hypothetical protein D3C81_1272200 [compost metagenome]
MEEAALADLLQMLVFRPLVRFFVVVDQFACAFFGEIDELYVCLLELRAGGRRPIAIVSSKYASRAQHSGELLERWLRVHPMEGLRAGDEIYGGGLQRQFGGQTLDELKLRRAVAFPPAIHCYGAHIVVRLDPIDLLRMI